MQFRHEGGMNKMNRIIVLVLFFMLIMSIPHEVPNYADDTDFAYTFVPAARGWTVDPYHGFVYTTLLKLGHLIGWMTAGRLISALSIVGCIALLWSLTSWRVALLLFASPLIWHVGYYLTTDSLGLLFVILAYWFYKKEKPGWFGLMAGLAFCTRYLNGAIILLFMGMSRDQWKKALVPFLLLAGFQVYVNFCHGFGILGQNVFNITRGPGSGMDAVVILKNLALFPVRFMVDLVPMVGAVAVIGFYSLIKNREYGLLIFSLVFLAGVSLTFYSARFLLPLVLPVCVGIDIFLRGEK